MEKAIQFTEAQKSLIWRTKVQPKNGTSDDALMFMEVCEQYGLNPLLNDIVFNRYETKSGPVVNFIVSRDGYLKAAMRDKDFVKCVSAVIKEGDDFEMDIDGNVLHKFGKSRGKIIGAWAYAEHAVRGKLPVVVDFAEYFKANAQSQNGRSPVWDSMPSMMIQKTAEIAALRRQFPLGGIVAAEEMGIELNDIGNEAPPQSSTQQEPKVEEKQKKKEDKVEKSTKATTSKSKKESKKKEEKQVEQQPVTEEKEESKVENQTEPVINQPTEEAPVETQTEEVPEQTVEENVHVEKEEETETPDLSSNLRAYTVLGIKEDKTPQGTKFMKVAVQDEAGQRIIAIARGNVLDQLDEVEDGQTCLFHIENVNGYEILKDVGGLAG